MPKKSNNKGRTPVYPWATWLKPGSQHILKAGKDFTCSIRSMTAYLYRVAAKYGKRVSVFEIDGGKLQIKAHRG